MAIYSASHLHAGGLELRLREAAPNSLACKGTGEYHGDPPHLASINPCFMHERIDAGSTYRLSSRYDNSQPWEDVMGIMLTYVWWGTQE